MRDSFAAKLFQCCVTGQRCRPSTGSITLDLNGIWGEARKPTLKLDDFSHVSRAICVAVACVPLDSPVVGQARLLDDFEGGFA